MDHGGNRTGAGRPSTGRKATSFYITEAEEIILRNKLAEIRPPVTATVKKPKSKKYTCGCPGNVIKTMADLNTTCNDCKLPFRPVKK